MKDIPGFEGFYAITEDGQIWSYPKYHVHKSGWWLKCYKIKRGYWMLKFSVNRVRTHHLLHRLVALTYIPNPQMLPQVNHKDGNKDNNRVDNLEWATNQENRDHAVANSLHMHKLQPFEIAEMRAQFSKGKTRAEIAKAFGVAWSTANWWVRGVHIANR